MNEKIDVSGRVELAPGGVGVVVPPRLTRLRAHGTATLLAGATSVKVPHSCRYTPQGVHVTPQSDPGARYWVSKIGATDFTINVSAAPGANVIFSWNAWTNNDA